jgi:hypothetical protein
MSFILGWLVGEKREREGMAANLNIDYAIEQGYYICSTIQEYVTNSI